MSKTLHQDLHDDDILLTLENNELPYENEIINQTKDERNYLYLLKWRQQASENPKLVRVVVKE